MAERKNAYVLPLAITAVLDAFFLNTLAGRFEIKAQTPSRPRAQIKDKGDGRYSNGLPPLQQQQHCHAPVGGGYPIGSGGKCIIAAL